jgi:hypothetical protein
MVTVHWDDEIYDQEALHAMLAEGGLLTFRLPSDFAALVFTWSPQFKRQTSTKQVASA